MPTRSFAIILTAIAIFIIGSAQTHCADLQYYVSANGNDASNGSAAAPFKSLEKAKLVVDGKMKNGFNGTLTVNIAKGDYYLAASLVFDEAYASRKTHLVFRGESGAVISGGRRVAGWRHASGNVWSADAKNILAGRKPFRNLYMNGKRLIRARHPNDPSLATILSVEDDGAKDTLRQPIPADVADGEKAELVVLENWTVSRTQIARSVSTDTTTLYLTDRAGFTDHPALVPRAGMACFVENSKSFLDAPGEWFLDESAGTVYYYAAEGEDPNNNVFVAPVLERLIVISGAEGRPVRNITFENISFRHAGSFYDARKYSGMQAGYHTLEKNAPIYADTAAIELTFASNISFTHCAVAHTDGAGIGIGKGSSDNRIDGCHVYDIGGNGIHIGIRTDPLKSLDEDWASPALAPKGNSVINSYIESCAQVNYGSVGIFAAFAQNTLLSANTVAHMPYTGISFGFRWNPSVTSMKDNIIEYNHIFDVMKTLADGGGIYTLGLQPGTVIRKNLIHDIRRSRVAFGGAGNNGIFFDEGTTAIFVDANIIYGLATSVFPPAEPIRFNQTKADNLKWGTNFFGVKPNRSNYPRDLEKEILDRASASLAAREIL